MAALTPRFTRINSPGYEFVGWYEDPNLGTVDVYVYTSPNSSNPQEVFLRDEDSTNVAGYLNTVVDLSLNTGGDGDSPMVNVVSLLLATGRLTWRRHP